MNEIKRFLMRASSSVRWKSKYGPADMRKFTGMRMLDMNFEDRADLIRNFDRRCRQYLFWLWFNRQSKNSMREWGRRVLHGNFLWYADGI